jgi:dTDP-4-amino-4,6-dideoxygalactose transaminase/acetyltransferase-like isoleucine patch superfamily enzyme
VSDAFIHPTAVVDDGATVADGAHIWHFAHVSAGAHVGRGTSLGQNTFVGRGVRLGDRVKVQNNVSIYEGVIVDDDAFLGPSCVFTNVNAPRAFIARMEELAPTRVGRGATIGANATIVCGHDVGPFAFVGAGAVVTRHVPAHALVVGNPARRIGWVSRVGRRLPDPDPATREASCPETGERYRIDENACLPLAAPEPTAANLPAPIPFLDLRTRDEPVPFVDLRAHREPIPFVDLRALHAPLLPDLRAGFDRVVQSGTFVLGDEVTAFEREAAAFLDVPHAVGVSSGTDALLVALMALGVGPGDDVVTTPFSFFATVGAIVRLGASPVFADVDPETLLLDPREVERVANPRTRAVIPVHLFGRVCDVPALRSALDRAGADRAAIVEDAAQAFGGALRVGPSQGREPGDPPAADDPPSVSAGALGDLGCFSFFPTKVLGALGDGGLVTTKDAALAERVRRLRVHGAQPKYHHALVGGNFRLDALQAALLRAKLPHVPVWRAARRAVARRYRDGLEAAGVLARPGVRVLSADDEGHGAAQIALLLPGRDRVRAALADAQITTEVYYPEPLHLQPALQPFGPWERGAFPHAERAAETAVCLPLGPDMRPADVDRVVATVAAALTA